MTFTGTLSKRAAAWIFLTMTTLSVTACAVTGGASDATPAACLVWERQKASFPLETANSQTLDWALVTGAAMATACGES